MFCPKCGTENPETGKFCRSCGTDLGNVTAALSGKLPPAQTTLVDRKGKPIHWESAITKLFTGFAFLAVSIVLAISGRGRGWWFWLLIPAFTMLGSGIAQYVQLKKSEKSSNLYPDPSNRRAIDLPSAQHTALPPTQTDYVAPESRYKTGDLVPPSVTDSTTRRLEIDKEGQTMTLPKV